MTERDQAIGRRIRERRKALGLTLMGLWRLCRVAESSLSRIETGVEGVGYVRCYRIAAALGCSVEDLTNGSVR